MIGLRGIDWSCLLGGVECARQKKQEADKTFFFVYRQALYPNRQSAIELPLSPPKVRQAPATSHQPYRHCNGHHEL